MPRGATKTTPADPWVTLDELLEELSVSERTFRSWRANGLGPTGIRLPNGKLRFRRSKVEQWLGGLADSA